VIQADRSSSNWQELDQGNVLVVSGHRRWALFLRGVDNLYRIKK
jgi:hypothetical protein